MNQQERDDLREKHREKRTDFDECSYCEECNGGMYPCDTIVVLDYAEFLLEELKSISAVWDGE